MLFITIEKEDFEKLICHHNFNDVLFSVGATWTFNKYNNIEK
jgi:hypothetical protein